MLVPVGDGSKLVYLGDITTIIKGYIDPPKQVVTVNGKKAISLHISLKEGANIIQLGSDIDAFEERMTKFNIEDIIGDTFTPKQIDFGILTHTFLFHTNRRFYHHHYTVYAYYFLMRHDENNEELSHLNYTLLCFA